MLTSRPLPPVTAAPIGPASGDLGGTYPSPTVTSGANHTHAATQIASGTLAVERGGTSGTTAAEARTALGAAAASHTHGASDIASGTLAVARGGTGSANAADARAALGVQDGPRLIPLASYSDTVSTVDVAVGGTRFDPADYARSGLTTVLTLDAIGQAVSGVTGTLTLRNLTDSIDAATPIEWTETSATRKTASVTLPDAAKVYELRFKKAGGATSDYAVILAANLRITWS